MARNGDDAAAAVVGILTVHLGDSIANRDWTNRCQEWCDALTSWLISNATHLTTTRGKRFSLIVPSASHSGSGDVHLDFCAPHVPTALIVGDWVTIECHMGELRRSESSDDFSWRQRVVCTSVRPLHRVA